MRDMIAQYQAILLGIVIGAAAHFGRLINDHGWPSWRMIISYLMQLGLVALVAALVTEQFEIKSSTMQSVTAAILAIAAHEVIRWASARASSILEALGTPDNNRRD